MSETKIVLMTINGKLEKPIDLEMLCVTIFPSIDCEKFIGLNNIYWFNKSQCEHTNDRRDFYNQCSFFFKDKVSVKLYSNGSFHAVGAKTIECFKEKLNIILSLINTTKYIYIPENNKLIKIYESINNAISSYNISLINYSIENRKDKNEFNPYKIMNITKFIDEKDIKQIESINDVFRYACISIKFNNNIGNIDFFKSKVIFSCKLLENKQYLINFYNKYYKHLVSPQLNKLEDKIKFVNDIIKYKKNIQP